MLPNAPDPLTFQPFSPLQSPDASNWVDPRFTPSAAAAPNMLVLPTLVLFTSAVLSAAMIALSGVALFEVSGEQAWFACYFAWAVAAALLCVQAQQASFAVPRSGSAMFGAMVVFLVLFAASTTTVGVSGMRGDFVDVARQSVLIVYCALLFFVLSFAARRLEASRAVIVACHAIVALSLVSILLDFTGATQFEIYANRYFGFLGDGVAWLLTLPLLVYFARGNFALAAVAAVGLLLTASRGPAFVVAGALMMLVVFSPGRRLRYLLPATAVLLAIAYNATQFSVLLGRFGMIEISSNDRVLTSINGLRVFQDSPIFGGGYGSLAYFFPAFRAAQVSGEHSVAVSTFVQMLSDGGLMAFVGYVGFLFTATTTAVALMRRGAHDPNHQIATGLAAWLLAFLWLNQSATWMLVGSYLAPLVFGVAGIIAGVNLRDKDAGYRWPAPSDTRFA